MPNARETFDTALARIDGLEDIITEIPSTPIWLLADGSEPCAQTDPDAWFPDVAAASNAARDAMCRVCPLQLDCMQWGIHRERFGVWGGLSPTDRLTIRVALDIQTPYIRSDEDALAAGTKSEPLATTPQENRHRFRNMPTPPHVKAATLGGRPVVDVELPEPEDLESLNERRRPPEVRKPAECSTCGLSRNLRAGQCDTCRNRAAA